MTSNEPLADALAAHGEPMIVPKAAVLFDAGEPCTGAYVVRSGCVDLLLLDENECPIWSRSVPAGGVLGLPAAVSLKEYSLRAVAHDNSELVFVAATAIHSLIRDDPSIGMQILQVMSAELATLRKEFSMFKA